MPVTMSLPAAANGQHRRSLNDSISRLDEMIDGLSAAIPETIRDTLKETVAESVSLGVKAAVIEVLTNADLLAAMRGSVVCPSLRQRLRAAMNRASAHTTRWVRTAVSAVASRCTSTVGIVRQARTGVCLAWSARMPVLAAVGLGLAVGLVVACAPPWAGALTGFGATCMSLVAQAGLWARRTVGRMIIV
jgi:hypothetical protein